jgi:hypothetical protein
LQWADYLIEERGVPCWSWQTIVAAFGTPVTESRTGPYTVLVWRKNLLAYLPAA